MLRFFMTARVWSKAHTRGADTVGVMNQSVRQHQEATDENRPTFFLGDAMQILLKLLSLSNYFRPTVWRERFRSKWNIQSSRNDYEQ